MKIKGFSGLIGGLFSNFKGGQEGIILFHIVLGQNRLITNKLK